MDPITAIGLATNVAQLVELSWKIVSKSHDIYRHGSLPEHRDVQTVTADLQKINDKVLGYLSISEKRPDAGNDDEELRALCLASNKIATQILQRLVLVKQTDAHRSWKSMRQAIKSVLIKSELDEMAARLQTYRTQLNTRILVSLRDRMDRLAQGNDSILAGIADSRTLINTSQEIQTDYLTRLITAQHEKTQNLLSSLLLADHPPPPSYPAATTAPGVKPATPDPKRDIFDAVATGSIPKVRRSLRDDPSSVFAYNESGQTLLHLAASKGDSEMVSYLIRNGAKINPDDDDGRIPLHEAVAAGCEPIVRALVAKGGDMSAKDVNDKKPQDLCDPSSLLHWVLRHGAQLEAKDEDGCTALRHFAGTGDLEAVRCLIDQGADLETTGGSAAQAPLGVASDRNHREVVELLLSRGANVDHRDSRLSTPLVTAGWSGFTRVGEILLDHGADIDAANQHDFTALMECCDHGRVEMAHMLVARGASLAGFNQFGYAPLHQAAMHGHLELVREMLDRGADVNVLNSRAHWTPLAEACEHGHLEIAELLLSRGARTEEWTGDDRKTALLRAAERGHYKLVNTMLDAGRANIEAKDRNGRTALCYAVVGPFPNTTRLLLSKGANVEVADDHKYTPLCRAAQMSRLDIVSMLVEAGASVNRSNADGWSPIHEAAWYGEKGIIEVLASAGANTNARDNDKYTPLNRAAQRGHLDASVALLDAGANIDLCNKDGWTSLAEASWHGHIELVAALLRRGARTDLKTNDGLTALALAKVAKRKAVVGVLETHDKGGDEWELLASP